MTWDHLAPFSSVVAVLAAVAIAMEHFLWRVRSLQGILFDRPDIRGTWKVTIQSSWINPETNQGIPPIAAYAAITQTASKLEIHLLTPESESCLLAHSIKPSTCASRFEIAIAYANTPSVSLRGVRSERHVGAAVISTHGSKKYKPTALEADYWTDRKTVGHMEFTERTDERFSRFVDARTYFDTKVKP
ncbi:Cap15 family cyclic dinucleotide receptor domain-containing protein [Luteimonas sp. A482]